MIRPFPFLSRMGRVALHKRYGEVRLTANDRSQKPSSKSTRGRGLALLPIPALFTRMSMVPNVSRTCRTISPAEVERARSAGIAMAFFPSSPISCTRESSSFSVRAVAAMDAPSRA